MNVTKFKCENCGTEVDNSNPPKGWIRFSEIGPSQMLILTVYKDVAADGTCCDKVWNKHSLDFCCTDCMTLWMESL